MCGSSPYQFINFLFYLLKSFQKSSSEAISTENISKTINKINFQEIFHTLLGDSWDIILGTMMLVILGFVWAYRRQTRLLYEQQRMRELMRLQELNNDIQADNDEPEPDLDETNALIENTDEIKVSDNDASPIENAS